MWRHCHAGRRSRVWSVDDVERESKRSVEFGSCDLIEVTDGLGVEILDRHRDHIVAGDDARLG